MDGESNYESDISESWSLIDINLNEESLSAAEAYSKLENNPVENSQKEKSSLDFLQNEEKKTDFSRASDSESDSFKNQGLPSNDMIESDRNDLSFERNLEDINKQDSCDAESIEILDMDDSEIERLDISQINQLNFSTYQSDDEESLEGNNNEVRNNNSPVIKRRKRKLNKNSGEETVNSINSENRSPTGNNLSVDSADPEEQNKLNEKSNEFSSHPVYKHYRNNVANTALSLSVGVIFAGVACIAIGHFLGVQDAAQTAVELVETLKKLEVENAALQSHLHQLNRALLIREINPKAERPLSPLQSKCQQTEETESSKTDVKSDFSGIQNSLNSMGELPKLQNYAQKSNKVTAIDYGIDFKEFGKLIQDQLHSLKAKQERGAKVLEEADRKISKELQEIISKLSSSQKDMANLNENVIRLKNIIDKIEKMIPESLEKLRSQSLKRKNRIAVTELDLQSLSPKNPELVSLYEFPKPESYYKREENSKNIEFANSILKNDTSEVEGKVVKKVKKPKNENKSDRRKRGDKTHSKEVWKKKEFKEKDRKGKKNEKKWFLNKLEKVFNPVIPDKHKSKKSETGHAKVTDNKMYNRTSSKIEKWTKVKNIKTKRKAKKVKNAKLSKVLLTKLGKGSSCLKKRDQKRFYSGPGLFNLTGHWIFKWADGREEIRKHQKLSDWQFERAKARKDLRDDDYEENWQFERAKARKELRDDDYEKNWQFKRAVARETNRNDFRGKYSKFTEKEFFHEGFSWI